jgi:hypothetical protein
MPKANGKQVRIHVHLSLLERLRLLFGDGAIKVHAFVPDVGDSRAIIQAPGSLEEP